MLNVPFLTLSLEFSLWHHFNNLHAPSTTQPWLISKKANFHCTFAPSFMKTQLLLVPLKLFDCLLDKSTVLKGNQKLSSLQPLKGELIALTPSEDIGKKFAPCMTVDFCAVFPPTQQPTKK